VRQPKLYNGVLGALIVLTALFIVFAPSYGWKLRTLLTPGNSATATSTESVNLTAQNEELSAKLAELQTIAAELPKASSSYLRAMVYSRYPLNFKNEILVNAGSNDGVVVGRAVAFEGILIGQVETVFPDSALVMTVFDDRFKLPVRVGSHGYDGLLQGGAYPTVDSIIKNAVLAPDDIVYAAGSSAPFGAPVGQVAATSTSPDSLFLQATLSFAYDMNDVQTVLIAR